MPIAMRFESPPPVNPSTMSPAMWNEIKRIESIDVTTRRTLGFIAHSPGGWLRGTAGVRTNRVWLRFGCQRLQALQDAVECRPAVRVERELDDFQPGQRGCDHYSAVLTHTSFPPDREEASMRWNGL